MMTAQETRRAIKEAESIYLMFMMNGLDKSLRLTKAEANDLLKGLASAEPVDAVLTHNNLLKIYPALSYTRRSLT